LLWHYAVKDGGGFPFLNMCIKVCVLKYVAHAQGGPLAAVQVLISTTAVLRGASALWLQSPCSPAQVTVAITHLLNFLPLQLLTRSGSWPCSFCAGLLWLPSDLNCQGSPGVWCRLFEGGSPQWLPHLFSVTY
jgi:hypothetical protein